jgi:chemotaxis protein methyltransferase CheR
VDAAMTDTSAPEKVEDIEVRLLLEALYSRYHYDFRNYAMASVKRRLRQAREQLGFETLSALQENLLHDPGVFPRLLGYLTVQVSEMFRDPSYFRAIREKVVPHLKTYPSLKVWVAGCSGGEELYSLAILFREEGIEQRTLFYATDINQQALAHAETGVFGLDRIQLFTENHRKSGGKSSLSDYYNAAYGGASFDKTLRQNVLFSDHSLVTDAVFGEMHLISCRNVLIYFDRALQDRALALFKDSLARKGFLGLGAKESLRFSNQADAFSDFVREEKIYQRQAA